MFLQEKKARKHLAATLSCHHRGISLGHEAETRRKRQLVSPIPSISQNDTVLLYDRFLCIRIKQTSIPGDTQSCWQESRVKRTAKFTAVTKKKKTGQFKLPHPPPTLTPHLYQCSSNMTNHANKVVYSVKACTSYSSSVMRNSSKHSHDFLLRFKSPCSVES